MYKKSVFILGIYFILFNFTACDYFIIGSTFNASAENSLSFIREAQMESVEVERMEWWMGVQLGHHSHSINICFSLSITTILA